MGIAKLRDYSLNAEHKQGKQKARDQACLEATMLPRIESEGVGSPTDEKAITEALNAINGVQEVIIENGVSISPEKKGQSFLLTLL